MSTRNDLLEAHDRAVAQYRAFGRTIRPTTPRHRHLLVTALFLVATALLLGLDLAQDLAMKTLR
ncbi:MAG: hypothetical protein ACYDHD_00150 [Vulcanimicrobiaceae bacterium]